MSQCSPEEQERALRDPANFHCLDRGESIGLTVTVEAGLLSLASILYVFAIILYNRRRLRKYPEADRRIFRQPMDILMASLLISDIVQAIGVVLSLRWVRSGKVEAGVYCTAQGIIKIFGATNVAFSTMAIAIYTFLTVWAIKDIKSKKFTLAMVAIVWILVAVLVTVAFVVHRHKDYNFMGPAPFWCWVNKYRIGVAWKMGLEYLWMWVTLAISFLIYIPLWLWMRGNLIISDRAWWSVGFTFSPNKDRAGKAIRRQALVMLAYPAAYCLCILPLSAVRWKTFTQGHSAVPPAATLTVVSFFALSGFFNAFLLMGTRPASGLFGQLMFPARPPSPVELQYRNDSQPADPPDMDMGWLPPGVPSSSRA